jgi:SAM-dependent methyltransferase
MRFFDPRFRGLADQLSITHDHLGARLETAERHIEGLRAELQAVRNLVSHDLDAHTEASTIIGESLSDMRALGEETVELVRRTWNTSLPDDFAGKEADDLDRRTATLLNYAESHRGFAGRRNLWFNPPISLEYQEGDVRVSEVNERIVELPYVLRALSGLETGASILDVGATESTLSLSLASLGYRVTAVDLRPYPFDHPNLRVVVGPVQDWKTDNRFDAVVCLSTIEHIGRGAYGEASADDNADRETLERIRELMKPGGLLVLTVPFGRASQDAFERTYDSAGLDALLEGWVVEERIVAHRSDGATWVVSDGAAGDRQVALVTAHTGNSE